MIGIPEWAAGAILGFLLVQLASTFAWAIRSDKRWQRTDDTVERLNKLLTDNNLAVLTDRVRQGDLEHARHVQGHERNRGRIEEVATHASTMIAEVAVLRSQVTANTAQIAAALAKHT